MKKQKFIKKTIQRYEYIRRYVYFLVICVQNTLLTNHETYPVEGASG